MSTDQTPTGPPRRIPFHRPSISEAGIDEVVSTLRSGWLTTGSKAAEFERRFQKEVGSQHAVALNSATAALHLALAAVGVQEGDEVIVPTMTFTATAEVVIHLGGTPVLVDCDPSTLNLQPALVEKALTEKTKAIVPVHYGGHPCEMDELLAIANRRGLAVVEDAAHAFPAKYRGRDIGTLGTATCFSFYANKTITTGEGGMVTTEDEELANRVRILGSHGMTRDAANRFLLGHGWDYGVVEAGYKYNLSDVAAALGIHQVQRGSELRDRRAAIASVYTERLADIAGVQPLSVHDYVEHSWHLYVVKLDTELLPLARNDFVGRMAEAGIGCSVHYRPLHMHDFYRRTFGYSDSDFPEAAAAFDHIVSLPIFPDMTADEVDYVIDTVRSIVSAPA